MGKLIVNRKSPGYVQRAWRLVLIEFELDITMMPTEDWAPIVTAALDHAADDGDGFRDAVLKATRNVARRRTFFGRPEADDAP